MNLLDQILLEQEVEEEPNLCLVELLCYFVELINNHLNHLVVLKFEKNDLKETIFFIDLPGNCST